MAESDYNGNRFVGLDVYNVGIKLIVYNEYRAIVEFEE